MMMKPYPLDSLQKKFVQVVNVQYSDVREAEHATVELIIAMLDQIKVFIKKTHNKKFSFYTNKETRGVFNSDLANYWNLQRGYRPSDITNTIALIKNLQKG